MGNVLKPFSKNNRYNKQTFALITQITTVSKKKVFADNIRCYCDKKTLEIINQEIINFLTK